MNAESPKVSIKKILIIEKRMMDTKGPNKVAIIALTNVDFPLVTNLLAAYSGNDKTVQIITNPNDMNII
tara:strand:- start:187 stop:393 length:207 start_codon:yes stop_codon:yes gene_type:complete